MPHDQASLPILPLDSPTSPGDQFAPSLVSPTIPQTVPISAVTVPAERQRKENKSSGDLKELKASILNRGLFHAPVIRFDETGAPILLLGERRFLAMSELSEEGLPFRFNGQEIPLGSMPYVTIQQMDLIELEEAELEENILRTDLTWQERAAAIAKIHALRQQQNPSQTLEQTSIEIVSATEGETAAKDKKRILSERTKLSQVLTVSQHLSDPKIAKAKNVSSAYRQILDHQKAQFERDLAQLSDLKTNHSCLHGDCRELMKTLPRESFDTIIVDPPYGIDADKMKTETLHDYKDSPDHALALCQDIFRHAFLLLKPQGIGFLFCDPEHFIKLRVFAEQQAFSTWRKPLIWYKGKEGHAPWGINGFVYTYECILFFIKGQKALVESPGPDVISVERVSRFEKLHAAEKPAELYARLLSISSRPGDSILDPCCGSGPIFSAAAGRNLSITGIELDPIYHAMAASRLHKLAEGENATADKS